MDKIFIISREKICITFKIKTPLFTYMDGGGEASTTY